MTSKIPKILVTISDYKLFGKKIHFGYTFRTYEELPANLKSGIGARGQSWYVKVLDCSLRQAMKEYKVKEEKVTCPTCGSKVEECQIKM